MALLAGSTLSPIPRALVTGITGQDGFYLAEQLLQRGYEVVGMVRSAWTPMAGVDTVHGDLADHASLRAAVYALRCAFRRVSGGAPSMVAAATSSAWLSRGIARRAARPLAIWSAVVGSA